MLKRRILSEIVLLLAIALFYPIASGADRDGDQTAFYPSAVFVVGKDRRLDDAAIKTIKTEFPDLAVYSPQNVPKDQASPYVELDDVDADVFGSPDAQRIKLFGVGLSDEERKSLAKSKRVWVASFTSPKADAIAAVKRADRVLLRLAELAAGGILYDDTTRRYYSSAWWKRNRLTAWEGDVPDASAMVSIDFYKPGDGPLYRSISLGMSKFDRPDVVVNDMSLSNSRSMGGLINLSMQTLVEIAQPASDAAKGKNLSSIQLNLDGIQHAAFRESMKKTLLDGAQPKVDLLTRTARHEEGDPDGPLLELDFTPFPGTSSTERQDAALAAIFGSKDEVTRVNHDDELLAASEQAKTRLPKLREQFVKGLPLGARLIVKGPFKTTRGGNEWMWVEVTRWPEGTIEGLLLNDPHDVPTLKSGAAVTVKQADVFDYMLYNADETIEGGETTKILQKRVAQ